MSRRFEKKLKLLEEQVKKNPEDLSLRLEFNMALLNSGRLSPDWVLSRRNEIIQCGDACLPLVEVLFHYDDPYFSEGIYLLEDMDTENSLHKKDHYLGKYEV